MHKSTIIVGVDPGVSGGCAILKSDARFGFPNKFRKGEYDRRVLDCDYFNKIIGKFLTKETDVFIETQQVRMTNSRRSVGFIWWYAGALDTFFRMYNVRIHYVTPKQWQSTVLSPWLKSVGRLPKTHDEWKEASIDYVNNQLNIEVKKHTGVADAYCIATYGSKVVEGTAHHYYAWEKRK